MQATQNEKKRNTALFYHNLNYTIKEVMKAISISS